MASFCQVLKTCVDCLGALCEWGCSVKESTYCFPVNDFPDDIEFRKWIPPPRPCSIPVTTTTTPTPTTEVTTTTMVPTTPRPEYETGVSWIWIIVGLFIVGAAAAVVYWRRWRQRLSLRKEY